jgi:hypothetical protein
MCLKNLSILKKVLRELYPIDTIQAKTSKNECPLRLILQPLYFQNLLMFELIHFMW